MIEQLRLYLIARGITTTIYIDYLPASPDTAIVLRQTGGRTPDSIGYSLPSFQIMSRAPDYITARNTIEQIESYVHAQNYASTISGAPFIIDIWKIQDPYFMGRDEQNRYTFVQNFQTRIANV